MGGETTLAGVTDRPPADTGAPTRVLFEERLRVPLWWWLPGLGVAGLLAAEVHMGYPGIRAWAPYLLLVPVAVAALLSLGRTRVQVADGELRVGRAHVPLRFVGEVDIIARQHKRQVLGPDLDPAAYLVHRAWVGPLVRVRLTDPDDPTPYWVFSTRRPEELAKVLRSG